MTKSMRRRAWGVSRKLDARNAYAPVGWHKNRPAAATAEKELVRHFFFFCPARLLSAKNFSARPGQASQGMPLGEARWAGVQTI